MKRPVLHIPPFLPLLIVGLFCYMLFACKPESQTQEVIHLVTAEKLMNTHPDSALKEIDKIDTASLKTEASKAWYALLKTQAVDRNYIDVTDFSILKPAIDYYLRKGTPEQKVKTLYYQARIYENRQEEDTAMFSLLKARELIPLSKDTLINAMVLQNQATLYYETFEIEEAINANMEAYNLYSQLSYIEDQLRCLTNALDGAYMLENKEQGDTILKIIQTVTPDDPDLQAMVLPYIIRFPFFFGTEKEREQAIHNLPPLDSLTDELKLDVAQILCDNGKPALGKLYFDSIDPESKVVKSQDYRNIRPYVFEMNGDYKAALEAYKEQMQYEDEKYRHLITQNVIFSSDKFQIEKSHQSERKSQNQLIWILALVGVLAIAIAEKFIWRHWDKKCKLKKEEEKRQQEEQKRKEEEQKNELLRMKNEQQLLLLENLNLKIGQLEEERDELKGLLDSTHIPVELRKLIVKRLDILNKSLVSVISTETIPSAEQKKVLKSMTDDKKRFVAENKRLFQALYPNFIGSLVDHGLTDQEIEYCCLWTLGLRSKEIGEYLSIGRYHHLSAEIRKKLGLPEGKSYLPTYLRSLRDLDN